VCFSHAIALRELLIDDTARILQSPLQAVSMSAKKYVIKRDLLLAALAKHTTL
jgi:hypothetical protein